MQVSRQVHRGFEEEKSMPVLSISKMLDRRDEQAL